MQLTLYTDYSLRTLIFLGYLEDGKTATINDVADYYDISRNHLMKVVYNLSQKGYITSIRGKGGGIKLSRPPAEINVGDVVRNMEPNFHVVECFNADGPKCTIESNCSLIPVLHDATNQFLAVLDKYTLQDLLKPGNEWQSVQFLDKQAR